MSQFGSRQAQQALHTQFTHPCSDFIFLFFFRLIATSHGCIMPDYDCQSSLLFYKASIKLLPVHVPEVSDCFHTQAPHQAREETSRLIPQSCEAHLGDYCSCVFQSTTFQGPMLF